jgi:drug/metabolite transporter (DMT)-like permease
VSFFGVVLIIQPPFLFGGETPENYQFYFAVLISSVTGAFSMIYLHDLRGKCSELVTLQHNYFFQCAVGYILFQLLNNNEEEQLQHLHTLSCGHIFRIVLYCLCLTAFAFGCQYLATKAMFLCSSPALISPFSYVSVIFAMLFDLFFYKAVYNWITVTGMIMSSMGLLTKFILLHLHPQTTNHPK